MSLIPPHRFQKLALTAALSLGLGISLAGSALAQNPEVTIYNQNFALVKDYRDIQLKSGRNEILLDDVAALIDPTSVHFKSLTAPNSVNVLEQNFRYDLINKSNILDQMVGKTIRFKKDGAIQEGVLLNPVTTYMRPQQTYYGGGVYTPYSGGYNQQNNSEFAVQTKDGVLLTQLHEILVDKVPDGLYPRPTLAWDVDTNRAGNHRTEISYLTDGMTWSADYVVVVNKDDNMMDLTGWVTLNNQSGARYENAKLKLVAGDVQKLQPGFRGGNAMAKTMAMDEAYAPRPQFQEESFFEYHLYTLDRPTTLNRNETKQVTLVSANNIPIEKKYIFDPDRTEYQTWLAHGYANGNYGSFDYYYNRPGQGVDTNPYKKINTLLMVENSRKNNLGMPLPKGRIRVNKADLSGSLQFVGEDQIDHTPEDEKIELYVGDAFDLVAEKKRTRYVRQTDYIEETYEVLLKNHKTTPAAIHVMDHLFGDWTVLSTTHDVTKIDAHTIDMPVTVPAKNQKTVTYTIRIKRK